ncbi:MAG: sigma factor [Bryobacteraceae bacterium]
MPEPVFDQALHLAVRAVQVRGAAAVGTGRVAAADREDLEQEALLGLWMALRQYDPSRARSPSEYSTTGGSKLNKTGT